MVNWLMDNENNSGDEGSIYAPAVAEHWSPISLTPFFSFSIAAPTTPV